MFFLKCLNRTSWDDDDMTPARKSTWDLPTPRVYNTQESGDLSTRRPTPAHRYNTWAKDRKRTGATPLPGKGLYYLIYNFQYCNFYVTSPPPPLPNKVVRFGLD